MRTLIYKAYEDYFPQRWSGNFTKFWKKEEKEREDRVYSYFECYSKEDGYLGKVEIMYYFEDENYFTLLFSGDIVEHVSDLGIRTLENNVYPSYEYIFMEIDNHIIL